MYTINKNFSDLGRRAVSSTVILFIRRIILQIITTGFSIFIARILLPSDYGYFLILMFPLNAIILIIDFGLSPALIQQQDKPSDKQIWNVFTITFFTSILCAILLWVVSPTIIKIFDIAQPQNQINNLRLLAFSLPLVIPGNISHALLERNLKYSSVTLAEIFSNLIGKSVSVILILKGMGVSGLVIGELVTRITGSLSYYLLFPWRLMISFKLNSISRLLTFGLPYQVSTLVNLSNVALVPFYIGTHPGPGGWSGSQAVGFITFAGGLAAFIRLISENIGYLVFPVISRAQNNISRVRLSVERSLEISSVTTFALFVVIFPLAREITVLVYTAKWLPAMPSLLTLSIQSLLITIELVLMNAILALGISTSYLNIKIILTVLQWGLTIPIVSLLGFNGYSLSTVFVSIISIFLHLHVLRKKISFNFISKILPYAILSIPIILTNLSIKTLFEIDSIWKLIFFGILNICLYFILVYIFMKKRFSQNQIYIWNILIKKSK